jgi:hypothetical protein
MSAKDLVLKYTTAKPETAGTEQSEESGEGPS